MQDIDVHIVGIAGPVHDYPGLIAEQCRAAGLRCSVNSIPFVPIGDFSPAVARRLRAMLKAAPAGSLTVYCSAWAEFFMKQADLSLHFSHYRRWYDPKRMRVLPYAWTNARPDHPEEALWSAKPPLKVGFLGMTYRSSRPAQAASRLPGWCKQWILEGRYLRYPHLFGAAIRWRIPIRFLATFPRFEALQRVQADAGNFGIDLEVGENGVFHWSPEAVDAFEQHLLRNTYILCPRGAENYSFRVYEALRFGRIPVIIDTEMVLPPEVPWQDVALVIPYSRVQEAAALIAEDYRTRTAKQFRERQQLALETSAMLDSEVWLAGVAREIADRVRSSRTIVTESSPATIKSLDSAPVF